MLYGHNYLHLRAQYNCFYRQIIFSKILKKHALMPLQREDYFLKKDKESIRILHISLKINVYLLQAAQCVFFFSLKRGNFISKQCWTCLLNVVYFYLGKDGESPGQAQPQPGTLTCLAVGGSSVLRKKWMSSPGILLLVLFEGSTHLIWSLGWPAGCPDISEQCH